MEQCTWKLLDLFQDIDLVSMFSQLFLEDSTLNFHYRRDNLKLVIILDQFCDMTLKSFILFLEHRNIHKTKGNQTKD